MIYTRFAFEDLKKVSTSDLYENQLKHENIRSILIWCDLFIVLFFLAIGAHVSLRSHWKYDCITV